MLELECVFASYDGSVVLKDVSVKFSKGVNVILGPNGSGKSTLLRVCAGVLRPVSGHVYVDGRDLYREVSVKSLIGYLPHREGLIEDFTVIENLLFYALAHGLCRDEAMRLIREVVSFFEIESIVNRKVATLSRGLRRRVALARTLLTDPKVLLLDEPTEGLDPEFVRKFHNLIRGLAKDRLILYTTHNLQEAMRCADYVCVVREGRIVFYGSKSEFEQNMRKYLKVLEDDVSDTEW